MLNPSNDNNPVWPLIRRVFMGFMVGGLLLATSPAQNAPAPNEGPLGFLIQIRKTTKTLKSVTGLESARAAAKDLENWRKTPMASRDEKNRGKLEEWMREEPGIETALNPLAVEMKRIETIGGETYAIVFEAMTGLPRLDLKKHFEELTRILRKISSQDDLRQSSDELKKWGLPVFKLMDADFESFTDELKSQPGSGPSQQAYSQELRRIQNLGPEFAESLMMAMGTREISDRLNRKHQEAKANSLLAQCKADAGMIEIAIRRFHLEYNKRPWMAANQQDSTMTFDTDLERVLTGEDNQRNPRKIKFLGPRLATSPNEGRRWLDPWGSEYRIIFDGDGDSKVTLPDEYGKGLRIDGSLGIDSGGPDGKFETTGDNVISWGNPKN